MVLVSNPNPYAKYKQQGVMTANPGDLIVMLYDGAIKQLKLSKINIENRDIEAANNSLKKTQDIITQLMMDLDFTYEISNQLYSLYDFMIRSVRDVNIKKEIAGIDPIIELLSDLRSAWAAIAKSSYGQGNKGFVEDQ